MGRLAGRAKNRDAPSTAGVIEKLKSRKVALDAAHDWLRGAEQLKLLKASKRASSRRAGAAHDPRCERGGIRGGAGRGWTGGPYCHICAGTGLTPATSAPGLGLAPATSAPVLGSPLPHLRRGLGGGGLDRRRGSGRSTIARMDVAARHVGDVGGSAAS